MSGIAGIFYRDGRPVAQEIIDRMVGAMKNRGPDGIHTWREGSVALGHCMLQTTPEAVYDYLPMESRDGNFVLTADARIDNRAELIRMLGLKPYRDAPLTDCDLILSAYQKWGEGCPNHLLGAFAFAIWDRREQRLFCARDHFGVKPLYWCKCNRYVAFASEVVGLLGTVPNSSMALDSVMMAKYLGAPVVGISDRTVYEKIRKIKPGNCVTCTHDEIHIKRYYTLQAGKSTEMLSDEKIIGQFRSLFDESVDVRMRNAGRTGGMLSGGLDSSSIVASAVRHKSDKNKNERFQVFSAVFQTSIRSDESRYIESVLDKYPILESSISNGDELDSFEIICSIIDSSRLPVSAGNIYINDSLYKSASDKNVSVVLSGFDGDTTVSHGREYLLELRSRGNLFKLSKELYYVSKVSELPYQRVFRNWLQEPLLDLWGVKLLRQLYRELKYGRSRYKTEDNPEWKKIINPDTLRTVKDRIYRNASTSSPLHKGQRERHREQVIRPVMVETLEQIDVVASRHGVEIRYPFFDKRLIEFCLNVPGNLKIRKGWTRYILRESMNSRLPEKIYRRRNKGNLGHALDHNLRTKAAHRFEALLPHSNPEISRFVDVEKTRSMVEAYIAESRGSGNQQGVLPVKLLFLEHWLKRCG